MDIQVNSRELKKILDLIALSIKEAKEESFKHAFGKDNSVMYCNDVNLIQIKGHCEDKFISFFTDREEGIKLEKKGRFINITDIVKVNQNFDQNITELLDSQAGLVYETTADYNPISNITSVENVIATLYLELSKNNHILRYETIELIKNQILNLPALKQIKVFFLTSMFIKLELITANYKIKIITARRLT